MRLHVPILLFCLACMGVLPLQAQTRPRATVMAGEEAGAYGMRKLREPSIFQGGRRHKDYYEGWYFKFATDDGSRSFAFIPGVALGAKGDSAEAFVQFIDGQTAETQWFAFPFTTFSYSQRRMAVRIGENYFSPDSLHVCLGAGATRVQADLRMRDLQPWPRKPLHRGIMGWYGFVPGMETCHGLVSLDHRADGWLLRGGDSLVLRSGRGYIEKDWGSSFPSAYIWMQSNVFGADSASFMCSIATIPYLGKSFRGFLGYLWAGGQLYPFATYTHAKLDLEQVEADALRFTVRERRWRIEVVARRRSSGELRAPQSGQMQRRISESIEAELDIRLVDRKGKLLFEGRGVAAGLEIVGKP